MSEFHFCLNTDMQHLFKLDFEMVHLYFFNLIVLLFEEKVVSCKIRKSESKSYLTILFIDHELSIARVSIIILAYQKSYLLR